MVLCSSFMSLLVFWSLTEDRDGKCYPGPLTACCECPACPLPFCGCLGQPLPRPLCRDAVPIDVARERVHPPPPGRAAGQRRMPLGPVSLELCGWVGEGDLLRCLRSLWAGVVLAPSGASG